ncbi:MAG: hypothetical protein ACLFQP_12045, partial [Halothece sp.]
VGADDGSGGSTTLTEIRDRLSPKATSATPLEISTSETENTWTELFAASSSRVALEVQLDGTSKIDIGYGDGGSEVVHHSIYNQGEILRLEINRHPQIVGRVAIRSASTFVSLKAISYEG